MIIKKRFQKVRMANSFRLVAIFISVNLLVFLTMLCYLIFPDTIGPIFQKISFQIPAEKDLTYLIHFFVSLLLLLTPLPATLVVIANGYFLGLAGFYVNYLAIIFASIFLYGVGMISGKQKVFGFSLIGKYYRLFRRKIGDTGVISSIFVTRFIVPFFFHNFCLGAIRYPINRFIIIILIAEVPVTLFFTIGCAELSKLSIQITNFIGYFLAIALVFLSLLIGKFITYFKKNGKGA